MEQQKYRITERLDAGGMAEVFRGVAESLRGFKKNVAIKRVLPTLTKHRKFVSMFLDEARLSLHLQHANIVQVFDIGVAEGTYFIVMEYVDGANLKTLAESARRQKRRLSVQDTLYVMMEVCKGLAYAHELSDSDTGRPLGIVHRDVSPPNILISKMGEVKLVDFGLAKAASQVEDTEPGVVKGKFGYLSPEAAYGKDVDRRADLFAVGILLYELLTGKRLFLGETDYQTVELVRQARVPSIAAQNPDVEPELEAVVRKALCVRVDDRFQNAADLQDALAHYLFSRGMKVTSSDIRKLVLDCQKERAKTAPPAPQRAESLIDSLIQEEVLQLTSIDAMDNPFATGAKPLSPELISDFDSLGDSGPKDSFREDSSVQIVVGPWDVSTSPAALERASSPAQAEAPSPRIASAPSPMPRMSAGAPSAPIQSLNQLLDGGARTDRSRLALSRLLIIAIGVLALLGVGAALVFRSGLWNR